MSYTIEDKIPTFTRTQGWLLMETSPVIRLKSRDKEIINLSKPQTKAGRQLPATKGYLDMSGDSQGSKVDGEMRDRPEWGQVNSGTSGAMAHG